ncbi:MAG: calcium-binding EGF-like domain-containing protein [Bacteroidia bacterium]|nr:calcium-binding EGF-like domain-containing protein [Bacteroidia bacterium]MCZ2278303.1 calcium-binding EGF-like domain-containing protein [Bacteroidia bacterium]
MKKIAYLFVGLMTIGSLTLLPSCKKDKCKDVVCQNGGTCDDEDGSCICATGYEGANCETAMADKFAGNWKYNETCGGNTVTDFTTTFTKTGPNKIQITGFAGFACGGSNILVNCTVNGRDITVDSGQSFCAAQIQISSGSGSLNASGNSISMTYTYTLAGSSSQTCTGTYTK